MFLILFIQNGAKYYLTDHVQFLVPLDSNTNLMRSPWQASKIRRETYYSSCCQSCISEFIKAIDINPDFAFGWTATYEIEGVGKRFDIGYAYNGLTTWFHEKPIF